MSKAGRTVAEILTDPATPIRVANMLTEVLLEWEKIDEAKRALSAWALERRATNKEGADV